MGFDENISNAAFFSSSGPISRSVLLLFPRGRPKNAQSLSTWPHLIRERRVRKEEEMDIKLTPHVPRLGAGGPAFTERVLLNASCPRLIIDSIPFHS